MISFRCLASKVVKMVLVWNNTGQTENTDEWFFLRVNLTQVFHQFFFIWTRFKDTGSTCSWTYKLQDNMRWRSRNVDLWNYIFFRKSHNVTKISYSMEYRFNSRFSSSANYANISFSLQKYCGWICAQPSPPPPELLRGICPPCQSRGWEICKFCTARGPGICQPPGPFPSFWHACGFLSEYNYTEGFTGKKVDGLICQGQE